MAENDVQVKALTPLRKIIAARMTEAKQTIPHYRVTMAICMDAVIAARTKLNVANPSQKVSLNDFVIKACANALMAMPEMNCQFVGGEIHQYSQADISIVVAVDGGLSTPVLREANNKSLQKISSEVKVLADRAAQGKLKRSEISGGTFSISNLGGYDVDQFDAIINPPQCAILALGVAKKIPVVTDGKLSIATMMNVSLSLDHRVIDGAIGAQFLSILYEQLQHPSGLLGSGY